MIDLLLAASLASLGIVVGTLSAMLGIGGGVFVVPSLILVYGLKTQHAVGTSLGMTVFTALFGTIAYLRQRRIDFKIGLITGILSVPAVALGAYSTTFLSSRLLAFAFGILVILIALRMLFGRTLRSKFLPRPAGVDPRNKRSHALRWSREIVDDGGRVFQYDVNLSMGCVFLFGAGFLAGLLGVGGGIIIVPIYTAIMGLPIHLAVATSLFAMIFTATSGVTVHISLGNVLPEYTASLATGIIIGTQIGASYAKRLPRNQLEKGLGLALLVIGVFLALTRLPF